MEGFTVTRLNLGCGGQLGAGWVNIDRAFSPEQRARGLALKTGPHDEPLVQFDLTHRWPWGDDSIDYAVAHHVLDLLQPEELIPFLGEARRVLRDRGVLRISSVSYAKGFDHFYGGDLDWFKQRTPIVDVACYCGNGWVEDEGWGPEFRGDQRVEYDGFIPCGACGGSGVDVERTLRAAFEWWVDCGGARKCILSTPRVVCQALDRAGFSETCELDYDVTSFFGAITELDSRQSESFYVEGRK
jgi:hypothetical protein